jgi:hypothetical protein
MTKTSALPNPFRWFDSSPEVIRLVVLMYVRYPLSLRNVEDLLFERGIDICHEGVVKLTRILAIWPLPDQEASLISLAFSLASGGKNGLESAYTQLP